MKKTAILICLFIYFNKGFAQVCDPSVSFILSGDSGFYPTPEDGMLSGYTAQPYSQTFTILLMHNAIISTYPCDVDSIHIDNITNLPVGLSFQCSNQDCMYSAGEIGCFLVSGTLNDYPGLFQPEITYTLYGIAHTSLGDVPLETLGSLSLIYDLQIFGIVDQTTICTNTYTFSDNYLLDSLTVTPTDDMLDWDIYLNGDQIYEGYYNMDYTFNQGYFNYNMPPLRVFNPPLVIANGDVLTQVIQTSTGTTTACAILHLTSDQSVSVKLNDFSNSIQVYPNPSAGDFTIEATIGINNYVQLEVRDIMGQRVFLYDEKTGASRYKKAIQTNLPAGVYFLHLNMNEGYTTQKIVIN